jgi:hypothetical protein
LIEMPTAAQPPKVGVCATDPDAQSALPAVNEEKSAGVMLVVALVSLAVQPYPCRAPLFT